MLRFLAVVVVSAVAEYDESKALMYAYLSTAAMCSYPGTVNNSNLIDWSCGPACDAVNGMTDVFAINSGEKNDAFAYGGKLNGECTLVFRGTTDLPGWMQDLKSAVLVDLDGCSYQDQTCKVGDGFLSNYRSLEAFIQSNLTAIGCGLAEPLSVSGHSLGAAEAAIATFELKSKGYHIAKLYTFGQPRVGDSVFAKAFEQSLESTELWRITHAKDPVVHLPFEFMHFKHVSNEVFYAKDVADGFTLCDTSGEDPNCANSQSSSIVSSALTCATEKDNCAHLTYMATRKPFLMNGDVCANPASIV